MSQNLSSAAVVIGPLRVNSYLLQVQHKFLARFSEVPELSVSQLLSVVRPLLHGLNGHTYVSQESPANNMASDFFQKWWAKVTNGGKNSGSFSEMMGPSISN